MSHQNKILHLAAAIRFTTMHFSPMLGGIPFQAGAVHINSRRPPKSAQPTSLLDDISSQLIPLHFSPSAHSITLHRTTRRQARTIQNSANLGVISTQSDTRQYSTAAHNTPSSSTPWHFTPRRQDNSKQRKTNHPSAPLDDNAKQSMPSQFISFLDGATVHHTTYLGGRSRHSRAVHPSPSISCPTDGTVSGGPH